MTTRLTSSRTPGAAALRDPARRRLVLGSALSTAVPLVLRSRAEVDTWAPSVLPEPSADLVTRLERLYADDPVLATALQRAKALHLEGGMAAAGAMQAATPGGAMQDAMA